MPTSQQFSGCALFILSLALFLSLCVIGVLGAALFTDGAPTLQSQVGDLFVAAPTPTPPAVTRLVAPELAVYTQQVMGYTTLIDDSLHEMSTLLATPHLDQAEWNERVHTYVILTRDANAGLTSLVTPVQLVDAHYTLLFSTANCVEATRSAALGIEQLDAGRLYQAAFQMQSCTTALRSAQANLNELVLQVSSVSAPVVVAQPVLVEPAPFVILPTALPPLAPTFSAPLPISCDPAYPDFCLAPGIADLDCAAMLPQVSFRVFQPDPHGFDRDKDGIGCEDW